jgi:excisionase family DNA binding protein
MSVSIGGNFYTIQQAAKLLDVPTETVHGLLRKKKLEAKRCEETGRWLLDISSVHRQSVFRAGPPEASDSSAATTPEASDCSAAMTPEASDSSAATTPGATPKKGCSFDADFVVLVIIGVVTLLAAGYTLIPLLF